MADMEDVLVLHDPATAAAALDPVRAQLLAALREPASAAGLALRVGLPRQKVNYHLRALEARGLVREVETRKWGGITERRVVASASAYLVCPTALGPVGADPGRTADRLSASYLLALAARAVREVGALMRKAVRSEKRLATLSIDTEISFRSAEERAAFSAALMTGVADLVSRYHAPEASGARPHRLVILAHPVLGEGTGSSPSTPFESPFSDQESRS